MKIVSLGSNCEVEPIVSVHLMGGLGNQLFQIFATLAYGFKYNYRVIFPYGETLTTGKWRPTYWKNFLNPISIITTANPEHGVSNNDIYSLAKYTYMLHPYCEIPQLPPNEGGMLHGYFQSYKYFQPHLPDILALLNIESMKEQIREEFAELFATTDMNATEMQSISMHFRRGDYKEHPDIHPILPMEYYEKAVQYILSKIRSGTSATTQFRVFVFCEEEDTKDVFDQIRILRRKFQGINIDFIKVADSEADWKQLVVMSMCRNNIIANSSFSWWGAFLNNWPGRNVCYPSVWFGPGNPQYMGDMFPEDWKMI